MSEEHLGETGIPEEEFAAILQGIGTAAPLMKTLLQPPHTGGNGKELDPCRRREALLCALKPYLSPERCAAIDYLLRLWRVGEAIKALGGTNVHPTDV